MKLPFGHPSDGDLVRFLDHQTGRIASYRTRVHLARCGTCAGRLQEFRVQADDLAELLGRAYPLPVPAERRATAFAAIQGRRRAHVGARNRWIPAYAGAAVLLIFALAVGVPPVRGWMQTRAAEVGDLLRPAAVRGPDRGAAAPLPEERRREADSERRPALVLAPAGEELLIEFRTMQRAGVAQIWIGDVYRPYVEAVEGDRAPVFRATPDGVRVENSRSSTAGYRFRIPATVRLVRLRVGSGPEVWIPVQPADHPWIWYFDLANRHIRQPM